MRTLTLEEVQVNMAHAQAIADAKEALVTARVALRKYEQSYGCHPNSHRHLATLRVADKEATDKLIALEKEQDNG